MKQEGLWLGPHYGDRPTCAYSHLPDVILCDQISQAFLSPLRTRTVYLHTASYPRLDWKEEWPENEAAMT